MLFLQFDVVLFMQIRSRHTGKKRRTWKREGKKNIEGALLVSHRTAKIHLVFVVLTLITLLFIVMSRDRWAQSYKRALSYFK